MVQNFLNILLRARRTVFSFKELIILFPDVSSQKLKSRLSYYIKKGELYHIRRGLYAKDNKYDRREVANKIYTPAYISFETVLQSAGIIFQYYSQIFVASYKSRIITVDGQTYVFRKIKEPILTDNTGIEIKKYYSIASLERAFLDMLYQHKDYYFDNLNPLNWDRVDEILPVYGAGRHMRNKVEKQYEIYTMSEREE